MTFLFLGVTITAVSSSAQPFATESSPQKVDQITLKYFLAAEAADESNNASLALQHFRLAAAHGHWRSMLEVANRYMTGTGTTKDVARGVEWMRFSAWAGYPSAMYGMGVAHEKGMGVTRDQNEAVRWWRRAVLDRRFLVDPHVAAKQKLKTLGVSDSPGSLFAVKGENGLFGFIDQRGKWFIRPAFQAANSFEHDLAVVKYPDPESKGAYTTVINRSGRAILPGRYLSARIHANGIVEASPRLSRAEYWSPSGIRGAKLSYLLHGPLIEDRAWFHAKGKHGFINGMGKEIVDVRFEQAESFNEGLAAVKLGRLWGYIDKSGQLAIKNVYAKVERFNEGLAWVTSDGKRWGVINTKGERIIEDRFAVHGIFSEGLAAAALPGGKLGFIDKSGKFGIAPNYALARNFSEGLVAVRRVQWEYIDKTGKTVIHGFDFTNARDFRDGLAAVQVGKEHVHIDKSGKFVGKLRVCKSISDFDRGFAWVDWSDGRSLIDKTGKTIYLEPDAWESARRTTRPMYAVDEAVLGRNLTAAAKICERLADQGSLNAMQRLANMYHAGRGVKRNVAKMIQWKRKAAIAGHTVAMRELGLLYSRGEGITKDQALGAMWLHRAATLNEPVAMWALGESYLKGVGVPQSKEHALKWFNAAALRDVVGAMVPLGQMYESGIGVKKNLDTAASWYSRAADKGNKQAAQLLSQIKQKKKTPGQ